MTQTSIECRVARSLSLASFDDLTDVRLLQVDRNGLLFDGDLTDEQVEAIWWRATSRDAADETDRRALKAALTGGATNLAELQVAYTLGLPLPEPTYPAALTTKPTNTVASLVGKTAKK